MRHSHQAHPAGAARERLHASEGAHQGVLRNLLRRSKWPGLSFPAIGLCRSCAEPSPAHQPRLTCRPSPAWVHQSWSCRSIKNWSTDLHIAEWKHDVFRFDRLDDKRSGILRPDHFLWKRRGLCRDELLAISQLVRGKWAVRRSGAGRRQRRWPDCDLDTGHRRSGRHLAAAWHGHRDIRVQWHLHELDGRFEPCRYLPRAERTRHSGRRSVARPSSEHPHDRLEQHHVVIRRKQRERFYVVSHSS